jgi:nitrite reductase/ring-hydroxylating ferredoxin subunit
MDSNRLTVGPVSLFETGRPVIIPHGRQEIGVYRLGETFQAVLNFCPHEGIKICAGRVGCRTTSTAVGEFVRDRQDEILACPWHGWQFDLRDGRSLHDPTCRLKTFHTEVEDGVVYVRLSSPAQVPGTA